MTGKRAGVHLSKAKMSVVSHFLELFKCLGVNNIVCYTMNKQKSFLFFIFLHVHLPFPFTDRPPIKKVHTATYCGGDETGGNILLRK